MDALKIKTIYWKTSWEIPNTPWTIKGYSRSAYRTGFYIPELKLALDAGPQNFNSPEAYFITHTHIDHIASLPFSLIELQSPTNIYLPENTPDYVNQYITSMFSLNFMSEASPHTTYTNLHALAPNSTFEIRLNKQHLQVETFRCDHSIPTISYGISEIKQKLKEEYSTFTGTELGQLRKNGVEITNSVLHKRLAYVCDTSISVFDLNPTLLTYPVIMIECTFTDKDELSNSILTKHIHWDQLLPYVKNHPEITWMLFHFSQRYRDTVLNTFFQEQTEKYQLENLHIWTTEK